MIEMTAGINNLNLVVNFIKEGKQVIAYAPALDLSTVGESETEAKRNFQEIVQIFFQDLVDRNVTSEVLSELGWKRVSRDMKSSWIPPEVKSVNLTVPVAA